ncbi:MAG: acyltransferase [Bdellovibrionota bacterium]
MEVLNKVWILVRKRPMHLFGAAGQYWRFLKAHWLQSLLLTPARGVYLGENVRVQALGCVSAELPDARVEIGADTIVYEKAAIGAFGRGQLVIGKNCIIGDARIYSRSSVRIGDRVVTSWNVFIQDFDAHPVDPETRRIQMLMLTEKFRPIYRTPRPYEPLNWDFPVDPISIGDDVWIGANVTILKGARIGSGCVIAAGAVVAAGEYPPRSIVGGVPARVLKTLS